MIDDGSPKDDTKFSLENRRNLHKQAILLALKNIRAAKAAMIIAASVAWIDTNPMTTKRLEMCEKMLEVYEKNEP